VILLTVARAGILAMDLLLGKDPNWICYLKSFHATEKLCEAEAAAK
jgi:hypothetical protein